MQITITVEHNTQVDTVTIQDTEPTIRLAKFLFALGVLPLQPPEPDRAVIAAQVLDIGLVAVFNRFSQNQLNNLLEP